MIATALGIVLIASRLMPDSNPRNHSTRGSDGAVDHAAGQAGTPNNPTRPTDRHQPTTATDQHILGRVTIAFGGDVHFEGAIRPQLDANPRTLLDAIAPTLRHADIAMVNLETAITDRGSRAAKQFNFRAPAMALLPLKSAGIDVVTMANNHGMDYGEVGLSDSLAAARAERLPVIGIGETDADAYRPFRASIRGERVSIIAATDVIDGQLVGQWTAESNHAGLASAKRLSRLVTAVREARATSDTVVVYLHWGTEMHACPTAEQHSLAEQLTAAGADIVVGSHAHVLLGGGHSGAAYIDYGLGNFVFYTHGGITAESGVLTLTTFGRHVEAAQWIPALIQQGLPNPLRGAAATQAVDEWNQRRSCTGLTP